jgi:hypothetical protein
MRFNRSEINTYAIVVHTVGPSFWHRRLIEMIDFGNEFGAKFITKDRD